MSPSTTLAPALDVIGIPVLATESGAGNFVSLDVMAWEWVALVALVVILLVADLLLVHRTPHVISLREAAIESAVWIALGLGFGLVMWWQFGGAASQEYYAGYLIEKSLSIDNVFVWAVILSYFKVPQKYQFRVLFWGVFGALVLRAIFIFAGVALISRFDWLLIVFGLFLFYTAWQLSSPGAHEVDPQDSMILNLVKRFIPTTDELHGQKMFVKLDGHRYATPLFAVLVLIEGTDVLFAVDSVPAILAVSHEPFLVFASNAFAILGLRALYFLLGSMKDRFRYLDYGLAAILAFVGLKMILTFFDIHIPIVLSLGIIFGILALAIVVSLWTSTDDDAGDDSGDGPGHPDDVPDVTAGVSEAGAEIGSGGRDDDVPGGSWDDVGEHDQAGAASAGGEDAAASPSEPVGEAARDPAGDPAGTSITPTQETRRP